MQGPGQRTGLRMVRTASQCTSKSVGSVLMLTIIYPKEHPPFKGRELLFLISKEMDH